MLAEIYSQNSLGVWSRDNGEVVTYSDGDEVEERLLRQLQEATDLSLASDELQAMIVDWPSEYHFSPLRANLLSSFPFEKCEHILEVGSGCGAITRCLGEKCTDSKILALEGSGRRAAITKTRCRDLSNVEVCHESFTSFDPGISFDCITLIGVLEYSPTYFQGTDPVLSAIQKAKSLLAPGGVLVVAIENQLGLKYFNGCSEDHSGQLFTGVNGLYRDGTYKTYGKKALERKLNLGGFSTVDFIYPFPDYKLPRLLLTDASLNHPDFNTGVLPGQYPSRDYTGNSERFFHESGVWPLLAENNVLGDMANSLLTFATVEEQPSTHMTGHWLAKAFSCPRKKGYISETTFRDTEKGIEVQKKASYPECSITGAEGKLVHHVEKEEGYIRGIPYGNQLVKQLTDGHGTPYHCLRNYLAPWVTHLKTKLTTSLDGDDLSMQSMPGTLLDCLPSNVIHGAQGELQIFDQEWESTKSVSFGFLFFRGLYRELSVHIRFLETTTLFVENGGSAWEVLRKLFTDFSCTIDRELLADYITQEVEIQKELIIYKASAEELQHYLLDFFFKERPHKKEYGSFVMAGGLEQLLQLEQQHSAVEKRLVQMEEELGRMQNCFSWKLGRALTYMPRLFRQKKR